METRSQTRARAGRSPCPPDGVLESPVPRPPCEADEDLGLATLMGDGDAPVVGRGRAMESATSGPGDAPAVTERVPAREPVIESSESQLTSSTTLQGMVTDSIPTLGSSPISTQA